MRPRIGAYILRGACEEHSRLRRTSKVCANGDEGFTSPRELFSGLLADELLECLELQLDHVLGGLVGQLERLLVELLGREGHEHFRADQHHRLDRGQALPQVILHARAAEEPAGAGLMLMPGGASEGSARWSAALKEAFRSEPQMVTT